jgi:hypothetical protein
VVTAVLSTIAHLVALLRDGLGWWRDRAIARAEADRIAAEQQTMAREAEHAARDEVDRPVERGDTVRRLHDGAF